MLPEMTIGAGLEFQNVSKSFGAVKALRGVSISVRPGEAHALVGENGAGKSTLLKILAGIVQPDAGEIRWQGERLHLGSPREALERGIGMVYQEMLCFPNLTVAGNIFAGRELTARAGHSGGGSFAFFLIVVEGGDNGGAHSRSPAMAVP